MNDLKSELSGNLEDCLLALLEPASLYDAKCLRRSMRVRKQCCNILCWSFNHALFQCTVFTVHCAIFMQLVQKGFLQLVTD